MAIMQGDNYEIPFTIKDENGESLTNGELLSVEFAVGNLIKTTPEIYYDSSKNKWKFPLTQEEAFSFEGGAPVTAQIRVKFNNGDIVGAEVGFINVVESISKGEL